MKIKVKADIFKSPDAWNAEWHATRNAAVDALIASEPATELPPDASRDEKDDRIAHRAFRMRARRCAADTLATNDALLYEAIVWAIRAGRDDERQRFSRAISSGLQALLGDDFRSVMYDIIDEHDIGHD